jgi:hypothetical protein
MDFDSISPITFWLGTVLPAVVVFASFIMVVVGLLDYRKTRRWRRRPTVPGIIIQSDISRFEDGYFQTVVRYRFQLNDRIYESDNFFHEQRVMSYGSETAREKIAPFPVGQTVQVRYNPKNPQESLVEIKSLIKFYFIGAVFLLAFSIIWAVNFWIGELYPIG